DRVVIDHRRLFRGPAHVPDAYHRLAIQPTAQALRVAEPVAHGHVMPAAAGREPRPRSPAMPMGILGSRLRLIPFWWRREQETHPRLAVQFTHPQGPVLVVPGKPFRTGTAFAHQVEVLRLANLRKVEPGFERNFIAVGELVGTARARIGE